MVYRWIVAIVMAVLLGGVTDSDELLAQRQTAAKGGVPGPPGGGGGGNPEKPLACFGTEEDQIPTQSGFALVATIAPSVADFPDSLMFGRPLAAALDGSGNIVLAVGSRGPNRLQVFGLDPDNPGAPVPLGGDFLPEAPRRVAAAYFNTDSLPDFVVSGFGPVQVLASPDYDEPITLRSEGDGIAATNEHIAVGVKGSGKHDPGEVFIYNVVSSPLAFNELGTSLVGPSNESRFGDDVALGDLDGDTDVDLVVGASRWKPDDAHRKDSHFGIALAYKDFLAEPPALPEPEVAVSEGEKNENLGWQVEIADRLAFVATKWTDTDRRVEIWSLPLGMPPPPPVLDAVLRPLGGDLGNGWASGDIGVGTIGGTLSALVGAPNAHCEGFDHSTGFSYLYEGSDIPQIFVPPHSEEDPIPPDWNAFGWSGAVIHAGNSDFVIIGEPGFRAGGRVYVYMR